MKIAIGIDVGGTNTKYGVLTENGKLIKKLSTPTDCTNGGRLFMEEIAKTVFHIEEALKGEKYQTAGVGIGMPGPVLTDGRVENCVNLNLQDMYPEAVLTEMLNGISVNVGNDANVAALGEMWKGGGAGCKNLVMVTLGTGVGGGVIVGGKIVVGQFGAGGEIGHMCVNYHETKQCGCGSYGCLEQYASATGIVRLATEKLESETRSTLLKKEELSAKAVFDAVKEGDEVATEIATEMGEYLGHALANIAAVLDPAIFVIGGGVSKAGDVLLPFIEKPFKDRAFFASQNVKFALATLGNDAGICGAAKMVLGD